MKEKIVKTALCCIILAAGLVLSCASSSNTSKEAPLPMAGFQLPDNVKPVGIVYADVNILEDIEIALLEMAEKKGCNGIINIVRRQKTDGSNAWFGSALAVRVTDENYIALFNATPKTDDRFYGAGSAKMQARLIAMATAVTRARVELAKTYTAAASKPAQNVNVKKSDIEQMAVTFSGVFWVTVSAKLGDITE